MLSKRVVIATLSLFCVLVFTAAPIFAQAVSTGTVVGQVIDPSGAAVAGATITMTDLSTKLTRTTSSNAEGRYIFVNVVPSVYDVTVSAKGFRTEKFSKQTVTVGLQLTLNATLQLGATTEVIEVSAAAGAELQTMNATVSTSFTGIALDSLPSITREATTFAMLQPGVTPDGSVAGAIFDQNTFQLDGGQNTNDMDGSMNIYTPSFSGDPTGGLVGMQFTGQGGSGIGQGGPSGVMPTPIDSIEEFKTSTVNQTADFNSSAGAQISMITRKGTDAWHGTAYEYYLDNLLNANTFNNNAPATRTALPDFHYSRFGGSVGGPLIPKKILGGKTYFFANYEGFRYPNSTTIERLTPGPGLRDGLIAAEICTAGCGGMTPTNTPTVFNLNSTPVTYAGPTLTNTTTGVSLAPGTYQPGANNAGATAAALCIGTANASCDPLNKGVSPTISCVVGINGCATAGGLWSLMPQAKAGQFGQACGGICDGVNVLGIPGNVGIAQDSNFGVARIDHDFSDKWHFFSTYRYYNLQRATTNQTFLSEAGTITALGNRPQIPWFAAAGLTTNFTSNFTNDLHYSFLRNWWQWGTIGAPPQLTGLGAALEPQGESTAGVLAPYNVNTQQVRERYWDGQDHMVRDDMTRLLGNHVLQWGGIYQHNYNQHSRSDNGGGINDYPVYQLGNGSSGGNGVNMAGFVPTNLAGLTSTRWNELYGDVLGLLAVDQIVYTRSGPQLSLNVTKPGEAPTPVEDRVTIPYYNMYFTDSWHIKPTVTLTYGLAWTAEMPPTEANGEQIELVDAANQVLNTEAYLATRKKDALLGQVYNPQIGFTLVGNAEGGERKYPYDPYYGSFSPRLAVAWNPNYDSGLLGSIFGHGKTVVRGGFSIIYGRLNGVDLVLVPLLGTGLLQPVQCFNPQISGACGGTPATGGPATSFRIGPTPTWNGLVAPLASASPTLPQPDYPGISVLPGGFGIAPEAAASESLDPDFRPNKSYEGTLSIQRQLTSKITMEVGYIGRIIRNEYQPIDLNAVPYMFTLGGQSFAKAYGNLVMQYCGGAKGLAGGNCGGPTAAVTPLANITAQPFFEKALGGPTSAYCKPFAVINPSAPCTTAVASNEGVSGFGNLSSQSVWSLWNDLDAGTTGPGTGPLLAANGGALSGPTMEGSCAPPCGGPGQVTGQLSSGVADNASIGWGNYNGGFISTKMADWHGLTMQSNFTYSKALGTGSEVQASSEYTAVDPYWLARGYGPQIFDRKFVYNMFLVYAPPVYKSQHGLAGHLLGGWSVAPIFVAGSGLPNEVEPSSGASSPYFGGQAFGEGDAVNYGSLEEAVLVPGPGCTGNFSTTQHDHIVGTAGVGTYAYNLNLYKNPAAVFNCFRDPVLGIDTGHNGGAGNIMRGQPFWNVDVQVRKNTQITERFSVEIQVMTANLFNHVQQGDPFLTVWDPADFGSLEGQINNPRQFEFGIRLRF